MADRLPLPADVAQSLTDVATTTIGTKLATGAQYGGAIAAGVGGFTANDLAAYAGIAIGLIGLAMNWWFKRERNRFLRERNEILRRRFGEAASDLGDLADE